MENKGIEVKFDETAGAWTDGRRYVKAQLIRKHSVESIGRESTRGRLGRSEVSAYWLDRFGVPANVL
jgi:hypothetical protein